MQRNTVNPVKIEVNQYSSNRLVLRPFHEYGAYYSDRVSDLNKFKAILASSYGLLENQDYEIDMGSTPNTSPDCSVVFSGEFRVLNALFSFPIEMLGQENRKYSYALQLTKNNCNKFSTPFVFEAQKKYFDDLKNDITNLHKDYNKQHPALIQINNDISILSERKDVLFDFNNFNLLVSALHNAIESEKSDLKNQKSGNILAPTSYLLIKYEALIKKYTSLMPSLFSRENTGRLLPYSDKLKICYNQIGSSIKNNTNTKTI